MAGPYYNLDGLEPEDTLTLYYDGGSKPKSMRTVVVTEVQSDRIFVKELGEIKCFLKNKITSGWYYRSAKPKSSVYVKPVPQFSITLSQVVNGLRAMHPTYQVSFFDNKFNFYQVN